MGRLVWLAGVVGGRQNEEEELVPAPHSDKERWWCFGVAAGVGSWEAGPKQTKKKKAWMPAGKDGTIRGGCYWWGEEQARRAAAAALAGAVEEAGTCFPKEEEEEEEEEEEDEAACWRWREGDGSVVRGRRKTNATGCICCWACWCCHCGGWGPTQEERAGGTVLLLLLRLRLRLAVLSAAAGSSVE